MTPRSIFRRARCWRVLAILVAVELAGWLALGVACFVIAIGLGWHR